MGHANPAQIHVHERDTPKSIVWCAISSAGLIDIFFFRHRKGLSVHVNGDNNLRMLQGFCVLELSAVVITHQVIFHQDGASTHYSREVPAFMQEQFPDR